MTKIQKVLIANRGEIALRIIRACNELGIQTLQVYSEADRESLPVQLADQAVCIGPSHSSKSYLNMQALLSTALIYGADAIHPGYGYLAENAQFARLCQEKGLIFIGPHPDVIDLMGDKAKAREMANQIGVPVVPGSSDPIEDVDQARHVAEAIGYPILIKASAGGGGRGMKVVSNGEELQAAFEQAKAEAQAAFGNSGLYIEKFLSDIRHIEVQVLGDQEQVLHFGERECTIQRRNQKLIEESPSPALSDEQRRAITQSAVKLAEAVGYTGAGTVEFILDCQTDQFYFIEMNTRIQVEHPVTEMITGYDLVKAQIQIAQGEMLSLTQQDVSFYGHAIECRINAEDPEQDFIPCPGKVAVYIPAGGPGIRIDSHLFNGYTIPPFYDSMVAKLIVWGENRWEALSRMKRALDEMRLQGIKTTLPLHRQILKDHNFQKGVFNTHFLEKFLSSKKRLKEMVTLEKKH